MVAIRMKLTTPIRILKPLNQEWQHEDKIQNIGLFDNLRYFGGLWQGNRACITFTDSPGSNGRQTAKAEYS
jgi:hypothetical protein